MKNLDELLVGLTGDYRKNYEKKFKSGDYIYGKKDKRIKDADTVIVDGVGAGHHGYRCYDCCGACPYLSTDVDGNMACYAAMHYVCKHEGHYDDSMF